MTNDTFLTYQEAAKFLNLPLGSLYSMVCRKLIPCHRFTSRTIRFSKNELIEWIEQKHILVKTKEENDTNKKLQGDYELKNIN